MVEATKKTTSIEISEHKKGNIAATAQVNKTTQFESGGGSTRLIQEAPVLEKVEKLEHVDVVKTKNVHEKHVQDVIEVHEKPVEKVVKHAPQEVFVKEQTLFETEGKKEAEFQRDRVIREMEKEDKHHPITFTEQKDVSIHEMKPSITKDTQFTREIIEKPIVTEIHHQPIKEIHEQDVNRVVYEKPIVKVVRDATIREEEYDANPMSSLDELGIAERVIVKETTTATTSDAHKGGKLHNLAENIKEKLHVHHGKKPSEKTTVETREVIVEKSEKDPLPLIK